MNDSIREATVFFEACRTRFAESQKRFQLANQNLQRTQQEFAAAQLEHNNWQGVVNSEARRLAALQQAAHANQTLLPITAPQTPSPASPPKPVTMTPGAIPTPSAPADAGNEVNKTELVRELLGQHPEGMTPIEVWNVLKNQIARPYVYSILKRLKDADEVIYQRRRKKYSLRVTQKAEEASKDQAVVH